MSRSAMSAGPLAYARIGGFLYLFIIAVGILGELLVRERLRVEGDPAATASNVLGSETLVRVGLAGDLLGYVASIAVAMIMYVLLEPVNRSLALLATFLTITATAIFGLNAIWYLAVVESLGSPSDLPGIDPEQVQSLMYLSLSLHTSGFTIGLFFFGFFLIVLGHLVCRSLFLPKNLGTLLMVGGLGYLVNSLAQILAPALAEKLVPWVLLPSFLAELTFAIWLSVKGLNVQRWVEAAQSSLGDSAGSR